jgi:hypothetical protein
VVVWGVRREVGGGLGRGVGDGDLVGGGEGVLEGAGGLAVDGDAAGLDHAAEGLALGGGVEAEEVVEESAFGREVGHKGDEDKWEW